MKKALAALLLLGPTYSFPQTPRVHRVLVISESAESESISAALKAKLGGTLRYQLAEDGDLWIDIQCVPTSIANKVNGHACATTVMYYPEALDRFEISLRGGVYVGPTDGEGTAQHIFQSFVNNTSDEELAKTEESALKRLRAACREHHGQKTRLALACMGL